MNRENLKTAFEITSTFLSGLTILAVPFMGFWLKYIFCE